MTATVIKTVGAAAGFSAYCLLPTAFYFLCVSVPLWLNRIYD
jgi:hypothetical protein